jgi:chromosome segregation ATPase
MQVKSTRGVQQDDVWAAADALIAEGLRPTIERVRQRLGRGSPNTVSPMLEAWFATLGKRLGKVDSTELGNEVPQVLQQGIAKLWESALLISRQSAAQETERATEALTAERTALEAQETELARREQILSERESASTEALALAERQFSELGTRFTELQNHLQQRENELLELRVEYSSLQTTKESDSRKHEEAIKLLSQERLQVEVRNDANHRRLLQDLDRSRQEAKQTKTALDEAERRSENARKEWEALNVVQSDKLRLFEVDAATLNRSLTSANERATELRGLLNEQRVANATSLNELNKYWSKTRQTKAADSQASRKAGGPQGRTPLKQRLLHKFMRK